MSQPFSRYLHPFEASPRPSLEPEVQRAILASWASDRSASDGSPATANLSGSHRIASIDALLEAFRGLDDPRTTGGSAP